MRTTITRHILVRRRLTCINKLQKKIGIFNSIVIYGSLKYLNNRHSLYIHICRCNNKCFITRAKYQQKYYPTNVCVFRHDCNKNDPTMRLIGSKKTNAINNNKKKLINIDHEIRCDTILCYRKFVWNYKYARTEIVSRRHKRFKRFSFFF